MSYFYESNQISSAAVTPSQDTPLPLTLSLLLTDALFPENLATSPSAALLIPITIINFPLSYFAIIFLNFATAFFAKWSSPNNGYSPLSQYQQAYPDISAYRQSVVSPSTDSTSGLSREPTPLFPVGLAGVIAVSAPFSAKPDTPAGKFVTILGLEIFRIQNLPKTFIPLLTLLIYFLFNSRNQKST